VYSPGPVGVSNAGRGACPVWLRSLSDVLGAGASAAAPRQGAQPGGHRPGELLQVGKERPNGDAPVTERREGAAMFMFISLQVPEVPEPEALQRGSRWRGAGGGRESEEEEEERRRGGATRGVAGGGGGGRSIIHSEAEPIKYI